MNEAPLRTFGLRDPNVPGVFLTALEVSAEHKPVRPLLRGGLYPMILGVALGQLTDSI